MEKPNWRVWANEMINSPPCNLITLGSFPLLNTRNQTIFSRKSCRNFTEMQTGDRMWTQCVIFWCHGKFLGTSGQTSPNMSQAKRPWPSKRSKNISRINKQLAATQDNHLPKTSYGKWERLDGCLEKPHFSKLDQCMLMQLWCKL